MDAVGSRSVASNSAELKASRELMVDRNLLQKPAELTDTVQGVEGSHGYVLIE